MPSTKTIGTPSEGNKLLGGVPSVHYFDILSRGRGQAIRLLFLDAGVAFTDVRYPFAEFPSLKQNELLPAPSGLNPTGSLPFVQLNGKAYTQTYPMLRHFSRLLDNKYDGDNNDEIYFVDQICDIVIDWYTCFFNASFAPNKEELIANHCQSKRPVFLNGLERHLTENHLSKGGPFVLGAKFTYSDIAVFQVLHDEGLIKKDGSSEDLKKYPRVANLAEGLLTRPNLKAYFESEEYLG